MYTTLISPKILFERLPDPDLILVDCRFSLADPDLGSREYDQSHIPGAIYAHLNQTLSAKVVPGKTGRHPVPSPAAVAELFSNWGITAGKQVVVYDHDSGAIASRLWWMLNWLGHEAVAVLEGGWNAWMKAEYPQSREVPLPNKANFIPAERPELLRSAEFVENQLDNQAFCIVDCRAPERFRGEVEPIDPVAGHIPGAINLPFADNTDEAGKWRSPEEIKARFKKALGDIPASQTIFYCGSGVTACHNILAMRYAGLGDGVLFGGSWSGWITDPDRPVEKNA
jgi:thiosulfate/3-mercaptopyruvate sulfurtransferase